MTLLSKAIKTDHKVEGLTLLGSVFGVLVYADGEASQKDLNRIKKYLSGKNQYTPVKKKPKESK